MDTFLCVCLCWFLACLGLGMMRVAACLCAASWHQKRPWMVEGPGERRGKERGQRPTGGGGKRQARSQPPPRSLPFPPPLTPGVPRFPGRGASITPLTAAPWVGSRVFSFTCGLRGLVLKPLKALMCHNWQPSENTGVERPKDSRAWLIKTFS